MISARNRPGFCSKACKYNNKRYENSSRARKNFKRHETGHERARNSTIWGFEMRIRYRIERSSDLDYSQGLKPRFLTYFLWIYPEPPENPIESGLSGYWEPITRKPRKPENPINPKTPDKSDLQ